jgi:hypothetical protein
LDERQLHFEAERPYYLSLLHQEERAAGFMYFINKLRHDIGPDMQQLYPNFFNEAMQSPPEAMAKEWDWFS